MDKTDFSIKTNDIRLAGRESDICHTVEELLDMNALIPKRTGKEPMAITEKALDDAPYKNKPSRGEVTEVIERQFGKRDEPAAEIIELQIENAKPGRGGHNQDAWDTSKDKVRGHKDVPMIWRQVFKQEDERKKLDKGQLKRKLS